jgi:hypothetical protein
MQAVHLFHHRWCCYSQSTVGGASLIAGFLPVWLPSSSLALLFSDLQALLVVGLPTPLLVMAVHIINGRCVHIVGGAMFALGFTTLAPCWPHHHLSRDPLGWHCVALVVVVGLVAVVVVLPGVHAVVITGIRMVTHPHCCWCSHCHRS